jgi:hypothetical protein
MLLGCRFFCCQAGNGILARVFKNRPIDGDSGRNRTNFESSKLPFNSRAQIFDGPASGSSLCEEELSPKIQRATITLNKPFWGLSHHERLLHLGSHSTGTQASGTSSMATTMHAISSSTHSTPSRSSFFEIFLPVG